jgi:hypothetical protein
MLITSDGSFAVPTVEGILSLAETKVMESMFTIQAFDVIKCFELDLTGLLSFGGSLY